MKQRKIRDKIASLPNTLNAFYAQFEQNGVIPDLTALDTPDPSVTAADAKVPTYFKKTTIIPVPEKAHATSFNDYCPVAVTSIIMKCFKRLVMAHINSSSQPASIPYNLLTDGYVLSSLLYSLYTHDCVAKFQMNAIYKFVDNTTMAIHDAEELLAEKRAAVARAEDKLSFAKLELREKLQRG
eukprot:g34094.t1